MQIITSSFADKHRATEVLGDLADIDLEWGPLDQAAAALTKNKRGKVRVHQSHEAAGVGAFLGGMTGFLAGLLVFTPIVGTAIGAATGGAIGSLADPAPIDGLDKKFLKAFGSNLANNSSALIVLVPDDVAAVALASLQAYDDGMLAETVVDAATEKAIRTAYNKRKA